jgi:hypothetical protein
VGYLIIRNSSQYPSDKVETLVRFALRNAPQLDGLEVHVKRGKHPFYGRIYSSAENCTCGYNGKRFLIVVRIGDAINFPYFAVYPNYRRCRKYAMMLNNWKEALVKVTAHEGMHLQQIAEKRLMWEHEAEKHAKMVLESYRNSIAEIE